MKLFDPRAVRVYFGLPPNEEEDDALREHEVLVGYPDATDWLVEARQWAERMYPDASNLDRCSFAGLVALFVTGLYGGYGTEEYERERQVEDLVLAFAGGMPAPAGGVVGMTPPLDTEGRPVLPLDPFEWTWQALWLMETAYFHHNAWTALQDAMARLQLLAGQSERFGLAREGLLRVLEKHFPERLPPRGAPDQRIAGGTDGDDHLA